MQGRLPQADPLPERRRARLLAGFIAVGLLFMVLPGTLLGVWNLLGISASREAGSAPDAWIQAHGHAQLFGWIGSFVLGITLYTFPKFRRSRLRSVSAGWVMLALWTGTVSLRWLSVFQEWHWRTILPATAMCELVVAILAIWQVSAHGGAGRKIEVWEISIFGGLAGLVATFGYQLALLWPPVDSLTIPLDQNSRLIHFAAWTFTYPIAYGFSIRFLPAFLGLAPTHKATAYAGLAVLIASIPLTLLETPHAASAAILISVLLACAGLRIFETSVRPAKTIGVDRRFPWFVGVAFGWLIFSAILAFSASWPGGLGASRHAFTVGFLATLVFSVGPRILPSFLNSRELRSTRLMLYSLMLLTVGCTLRVIAEPLAYSGLIPGLWSVLPVSATLELLAVVFFAGNLMATMLSPVPAWISRKQVNDSMSLYWYIHSYPATRRLLVKEGLTTLASANAVPRSLTLREAAEADGADPDGLVRILGEFFESRLARSLRANSQR
ncbi:MAG: NnrS family protein [Bryobacteraceae bacterium]|nr:NnrS family protein [Bryobacteraceae bacterium]